MIQIVRVSDRNWPDAKALALAAEIRRVCGIEAVGKIRVAKVYRFEGIDAEAAEMLARKFLADGLTQEWTVNAPLIEGASQVREIACKPGVMNPEAASLLKCGRDLGLAHLIAADSSREYGFYGCGGAAEVNTICGRLLFNATTERIVDTAPETLVIKGSVGAVRVVSIRDFDDDDLMSLSRESLYLDGREMSAIKEYFTGLGRDPTDAELETLAQTWSEHCGHKTFKARSHYMPVSFIERLRRTAENNGKDIVSAFVDNSGVMRFYDGWAVCGKVETHNSPSAIEPYGGASTGSGGVFRDILGTGKGAKVIASTDIFCVAPPDLPESELPAGCIRPDTLLGGLVRGVRDYGNRMGIPTVNGSVHFHRDFRAKPAVIVGAYGLIPEAIAQKGRPRPGDKVVLVGGRTGRDGIHGATFSSGAMTGRTGSVHSSAVQIGNAIEEKRVLDALLECRDRRCIVALTDCGAGGLSSAVGEMGEELGVSVDLEKVPVKYPGLAPWEIWVSESQERMVAAVRRGRVRKFLAICASRNVEAVVIGEFGCDRHLRVSYGERAVCDLEMEFLYRGCPPRALEKTKAAHQPRRATVIAPPADRAEWERRYLKVMAHGNICSKEPIVRMYDHTVQAATALPAFVGVRQDGPTDACVLAPLPGKPYGLVLSHGLHPALIRLDPHFGSDWALAEAISNFAAVGGNIREAVLIDNFIWPVPVGERVNDLDCAVNRCTEAARTFGIPFISGKDSLSGTYVGAGGKIEMPPTLCISVMGRVTDVSKTASSDFKRPGSAIVLLGYMDDTSLGGSAYAEALGAESGTDVPRPFLYGLNRFVDQLHDRIVAGEILSCHDVSDGGMAAALAEMCFGGEFGASVDLSVEHSWHDPRPRPDQVFFNETAGCFLLKVRPEALNDGFFRDFPCFRLGETLAEPIVRVRNKDETLCLVPVADLKAAWSRPMQEFFR